MLIHSNFEWLSFYSSLPFNKFSTNAAIHLTEIYEYAQMLANKHFLIPNFQAYKFIYACRLADFGFTSQVSCQCITLKTLG